MKLSHKAVIELFKVFKTIRAGFLEFFKEQNLVAWVKLFQHSCKLRHGKTAGWNTYDIVDEPFNELLGNVFTGEIFLGDFPRLKELMKWYSPGSKRQLFFHLTVFHNFTLTFVSKMR